MNITDFKNPEAVRQVLGMRSRINKIGWSIENPPCDERDEALKELVDHGAFIWMDRCRLSAAYGDLCNIYMLSPDGLDLCAKENIPSH